MADGFRFYWGYYRGVSWSGVCRTLDREVVGRRIVVCFCVGGG